MRRLVVGLLWVLLLQGCAKLDAGATSSREWHTITMYPGAWR